jgi:hypothetical protein
MLRHSAVVEIPAPLKQQFGYIHIHHVISSCGWLLSAGMAWHRRT